ncbi:DUF2723 domain-containing protein [Chitinophaga parva]|uniref:DUF2723 domain-containing protein n=1 Tax=Chitinophaga parva TaxID=2169414 RepID=A0A2T7BHI8_9BACT|nr:DUF2723 domain-containing protein [Chitinophaga parva]PUZ25746.1 DUF2723 domain-containing protein [Chitinophaga parva]
MNFNRINNIVGWIVCIIACTVYVMTMEATGSLWDCGEFISSIYKVQVPHPPGAPLFVLIGRIFTLPLSPSKAALGVNFMSAIASGFTILFLFWSITHFARRLMITTGEVVASNKMIAIMGAGAVGALAYTFSDSFWFSAVEGEVYAMSSLFTALVFWLMLKWEHEADRPNADRYIVLIAFMMGLSIGVHLLNLLTIPAMVMIYYFRRYKVTTWGIVWAFVMGCVITGLVQKFLIQDTIKASGLMDVFFVNSLHLPFFSGFAFYFIALVAVLGYGYVNPKVGVYGPLVLMASVILIPGFNDGDNTAGLIFRLLVTAFLLGLPYLLKVAGYPINYNRIKHVTRLAAASILFLLLGYSTYITTMVRSTANPSVDMYNVDNPISLVGYLGREQYGDFPLVYGQVFTARPTEYKTGGNNYARGPKNYVITGQRSEPVYAAADKMLFPRVWDGSNDQGHADYYRDWLGLAQGQAPSYADNIKFFLGYQVNFMYFRYFMWNFSGKQNDVQGYGNPRDGNWITGIPFIDNLMYGDQDLMPDSLKNSKAHNVMFMLPLILGILGFVYQYQKGFRDWLVVGLLFFFTGLAIVVYLNQAGNQPRERDYAYVGSFYAFAIWIGLGVLWLYDKLLPRLKGSTGVAVTAISLLAVPLLMGFQEWDDHDRSQKTLARDVAKDYLESCQPNAILFTVGDNDTYPLWYAQEVEGIRPDIRVINLSLLGVDWYIDQQRAMVNKAPGVPMSWTPDKYNGENRNYVQFFDDGRFPQNKYFNLKEVMAFMGSDEDAAKVVNQNDGDKMNYLPSKNLVIPVNRQQVISNGTVSVGDTARIVDQVQFQIPQQKNFLLKNDLALLDIISANNWNRPIYFTSPTDLGLNDYLQTDGLTYHLVPLRKAESNDPFGMDNNMNVPVAYNNLMTKFAFGGAEKKGTYFDEPNRKLLLYVRNAFTKEGIALAQQGNKEKALTVLNKADQNLLESNFPYAMTSLGNTHNYYSLQTVYAYYLAGDLKKAGEISQQITKDCQQQINYFRALPANRQSGSLEQEARSSEQFIGLLQQLKQQFSDAAKAQELQQKMNTSATPADSAKK